MFSVERLVFFCIIIMIIRCEFVSATKVSNYFHIQCEYIAGRYRVSFLFLFAFNNQ